MEGGSSALTRGVGLSADGHADSINLVPSNSFVVLGRGSNSSEYMRQSLTDPSISRQHVKVELLLPTSVKKLSPQPSVRVTVLGVNPIVLIRREQSSTRGESALLSRGQSAVLEIGDGFSFCRGFPGVIRVVDYPPPAAAAVVEVAATSGAATSDNTGGIERRRAHGGGGQGCGGDQHHGTTDRGAGSDAIRDDGLDHVMDDTTRASAAATSAAVCTDFPDNGDTDDGSDVRCKGQDESISRKTHEVSSDSCEISNTLDSERAENSQENTEAFEMPVPHIISQDPDALGCGEIDPENINRSPHSGGGCGVDKDGQDRRVHSESPLRGSNNDRCGSVSPSGGGRDRGDDGISMMEQPPTSKAATHNVKPRASARQPGSPPPPLQAAATSTASIETLEGLRVALIKLGLSKQRRKLFQERAAQFGAEALDWPMAPSSTQVAANNKDNGTDPKPPPGLLSPATAHGAASLLGPLARSRRMMGGKGKGKKRAREGSSWQTSGVRGTPTVPPTPTRRRRDQLTPISPPPQNLDHSEYSAKRSEKSVPGTSTKRSCESPREGLATRSMTTDSDDLMTTNTTSTIASGDTGCTTFAGSDVAAAAVSTGGRTGRDGSGIESSGYWGGGSSVVAELVRHGFTHAICAANAPRRLLWAELGLLPESPAAAPVRKGGGDSGGTLGDGMTAGAAVEIVSEEWLVNCLQEQRRVPEAPYRLSPPSEQSSEEVAEEDESRDNPPFEVKRWACQRPTPRKHHNSKPWDEHGMDMVERWLQAEGEKPATGRRRSAAGGRGTGVTRESRPHRRNPRSRSRLSLGLHLPRRSR